MVSSPQGPPPRPLVLLPTGPGEPKPLVSDEAIQDAARFFPDGKRIVFAGSEPGQGVRLYVQDLAGGRARPFSPEGIRVPIAVSPDGRLASARGPDGETWLYPVEGGQPVRPPGIQRGEALVCWSRDGRSLYLRQGEGTPVRLFRVDVSTGRRELWKELSPSDASGLVGLFEIHAAPEAGAYAYTYERTLSDLFLVGGIK